MLNEVSFFKALTWALVVAAIGGCLVAILTATPSYCLFALVPYVGAQFTKKNCYGEYDNIYIRIRQLGYVILASFAVAGIFWWIHQTVAALTELSATTGIAPRGIVAIVCIIVAVAIHNNMR